MRDTYTTINSESYGDYRERGSKFISSLFPCDSETALKAKIEAMKKEHSSARHFCFGAIIGFPDSLNISSDSGEPSGTAGAPILNQLLSSGLVNAAIVIVRHYGGTKLGKAGLINAYKQSARLAIENCSVVTQVICNQLTIDYRYEDTSEVMRLVDGIARSKIIDQSFLERCTMRLEVPKSLTSNALLLFEHMPHVTVNLEEN
ncbi:MAG: YigZ family protein [Salibacteraceae bacterium]